MLTICVRFAAAAVQQTPVDSGIHANGSRGSSLYLSAMALSSRAMLAFQQSHHYIGHFTAIYTLHLELNATNAQDCQNKRGTVFAYKEHRGLVSNEDFSAHLE